ncbi:membrane fusion protein, multidrug efflux system [Rhodoblastus acidophilus]|uniref:Membrane fusion protein, multidrug efflux system n=1 Tax=Rhodoblastus acidophilus TaxID=1074 RepID=A0A212S760_RHOAC|nr:HlyD family secretion protein [Rhodoblastus acidophilus]SNB80935.1 membrane fusion protein, multidrug efflux system [Rhodoblastus acidophilus]
MNEPVRLLRENTDEPVEPVFERAAPGARPPQSPPVTTRKNKQTSRKSLLIGAALLAALGAGYAGLRYYQVGRFIVSTDDAYVRTDLAVLAPKVPGYVDQVLVTDNDHVKAGQVLVRLDAGDYDLAVVAAAQKVSSQDATIARVKTQIDAQQAAIAQARAQVTAAKADSARAESEFARAKSLVANAFASRQRLEQAEADRDRAAASVVGAEAAAAGALANLAVLHAQQGEAERLRAELVTAKARAERDLSFAVVKAPFDGVVGNRAAQPGQYVQTGTRLMALAPDAGFYVEGNFKETQLAHMKPGQKVEARVDAYGGRVFAGEVQSLAPASGADYSLLPPENATGNFTKIIQRFPVRIRLPAEAQPLMRSGMSVIVDVDTREAETK